VDLLLKQKGLWANLDKSQAMTLMARVLLNLATSSDSWDGRDGDRLPVEGMWNMDDMDVDREAPQVPGMTLKISNDYTSKDLEELRQKTCDYLSGKRILPPEGSTLPPPHTITAKEASVITTEFFKQMVDPVHGRVLDIVLAAQRVSATSKLGSSDGVPEDLAKFSRELHGLLMLDASSRSARIWRGLGQALVLKRWNSVESIVRTDSPERRAMLQSLLGKEIDFEAEGRAKQAIRDTLEMDSDAFENLIWACEVPDAVVSAFGDGGTFFCLGNGFRGHLDARYSSDAKRQIFQWIHNADKKHGGSILDRLCRNLNNVLMKPLVPKTRTDRAPPILEWENDILRKVRDRDMSLMEVLEIPEANLIVKSTETGTPRGTMRGKIRRNEHE